MSLGILEVKVYSSKSPSDSAKASKISLIKLRGRDELSSAILANDFIASDIRKNRL